MIFDLKFHLSVSSSPKSHKGELTMGEWADAAFIRLKEQEGKDHATHQQWAEMGYQIRTQAPFLWKSLVGQIKSEIEDFSKKRPDYLEFEDYSDGYSDQHIVLMSPRIAIEVAFEERPAITYTVHHRQPDGNDQRQGQGAYTFGVLEGGKVWFLDDQQKGRQVSEVKRNILNYLL
jgi:hypothetical protein